jgi:DNA-binding transcriptional LysR family regulator
MEYGSYHAIVACAAAGAGVAVVPRSVIDAVLPKGDVAIHPLPADIAEARTMLAWRGGHRSAALDALRAQLSRAK